MELLNRIRKPEKKIPFSKAVLCTFLIVCAGLITGAAIKLFDIYTSNLGNIFSQVSVWIFLCSLLAVYSSTAKRAAVNVVCFCAGMLLAYYVTAELTNSVYSPVFIYGWTIFALVSPVLGFCTWYAKGNGIIPKIISAGILAVMLAAAVLLFDKIRISDVICAVLLGVVLFKK